MQNVYESKQKFKYFFIITAIIIAIGSVLVTNALVNSLADEERKRIEIWAESIKLMSIQTLKEGVDQDIFNDYDNLILKLINGNTTIPVILADEDNNVILNMNI
jgi:hypothetical protein